MTGRRQAACWYPPTRGSRTLQVTSQGGGASVGQQDCDIKNFLVHLGPSGPCSGVSSRLDASLGGHETVDEKRETFGPIGEKPSWPTKHLYSWWCGPSNQSEKSKLAGSVDSVLGPVDSSRQPVAHKCSGQSGRHHWGILVRMFQELFLVCSRVCRSYPFPA